MRLNPAALAVALVVASGCLGAPDVPRDAPAAAQEPGLPVLPSVDLADCLALRVASEVARSRVQATLPAGLEVVEVAPGVATLHLEAGHCGRARGLRHVSQNVSFLRATVPVHPTDAAWSDRDASVFVLESHVSDADLAAEWSEAGLATGILRAGKQPGPVDDLEVWTFATSRATFRALLAPREATFHGDAPTHEVHEWAGAGPVSRADVLLQRYPHNRIRDGGLVEFEGTGPFLEARATNDPYVGPLGLHGLRWTAQPAGTYPL